MKLHDITPSPPDWVITVARAWHRYYGTRHMPLIYNENDDQLDYTLDGIRRVRVQRHIWADWEREPKTPQSDPSWVVIE